MSTQIIDVRVSEQKNTDSLQYATFYLGDRLYGIDVMQVQEVTKPLAVTSVPLSPNYVKGLINLRGQIATAVGLRELFQLDVSNSEESMTVVCRVEGSLLSLLVDKIGDVVEVPKNRLEPPPDTVNSIVRKFMTGVYMRDDSILSVIDIENISLELNK